MKTISEILNDFGKESTEQKLVIELIKHSAMKRKEKVTNQFVMCWIQKYAQLIRKHYDDASKKTNPIGDGGKGG